MRNSRIPLCHVALNSRTGMRMRMRGLGVNALDHVSDLFELGEALPSDGDQSAFRLVSQRDAAWAGVLFVAAAARA